MKHSCKFMHFRLAEYDMREFSLTPVGISPQGGATVAYTEKDGKLFAATACCNPKDNFNYAYGRNKAAGRLTQLLHNPEKQDDEMYHIFPAEDGLESLRKFFEDSGYIHRGPRK